MDKYNYDRFVQSYSELIIEEIRARLGVVNKSPQLSSMEINFLLQSASIFSLTEYAEDNNSSSNPKVWAYDVATRLAETYGLNDQNIRVSADFILSRLGNFPGRELLREKLGNKQDNEHETPILLALEASVREDENTVEFPHLGSRLLTDFQFRLTDSLRRSQAISVSAPTSAGKSFVLAHDILTELAENSKTILVYLVPTRALIQQVTRDLLQLFRQANLPEIIVSAAPISFSEEQVTRGIVYVLTQERLSSMLGSPDFALSISKVYVDEAQEIGDKERGLILDSVIREVITRFPKVRLCFASPLTSNPGYLFHEFQLSTEGEFFTDTCSPVSQVVVRLEPIKGSSQKTIAFVYTPEGSKEIGEIELPFKFRGVRDRLANTAIFIRKQDESVIVFANRPDDAIKVAEKIAEQIDHQSTDQDVLDLVSFVKSHVHPSYALADILQKGVAFHYGRMPHIIRTQVEDLLRSRKIQYVVSTSTLLQGINLPAQHIVVLAPRKGSGKPMEAPDFWNLVGRAGRLRENFRGIVWCIDPESWGSQPFDGAHLSEIKSAFESSLEDEEIREASIAILEGNVPLSMVKRRNAVEQFLGKAFCEFTLKESKLSESPRVPESIREKYQVVDNLLEKLTDVIEVPPEVCNHNSVISPTLLNDLWKYFKGGIHYPMIPIDPYIPGSLFHFQTIFRVIDEIFINSGNNSHRYYAALGYNWVLGKSLKELITNRIDYYKIKRDKESVNRAIRELLDSIEDTLRFTYVKYLKAYNDVLRAFLLNSGEKDVSENLAPLDLYVELGARDRVLLMLMALGVSRTTAILIRRAITNSNEITREECLSKLQNLPLKVLDLPEICKLEIRNITGNQK